MSHCSTLGNAYRQIRVRNAFTVFPIILLFFNIFTKLCIFSSLRILPRHKGRKQLPKGYGGKKLQHIDAEIEGCRIVLLYLSGRLTLLGTYLIDYTALIFEELLSQVESRAFSAWRLYSQLAVDASGSALQYVDAV